MAHSPTGEAASGSNERTASLSCSSLSAAILQQKSVLRVNCGEPVGMRFDPLDDARQYSYVHDAVRRGSPTFARRTRLIARRGFDARPISEGFAAEFTARSGQTNRQCPIDRVATLVTNIAVSVFKAPYCRMNSLRSWLPRRRAKQSEDDGADACHHVGVRASAGSQWCARVAHSLSSPGADVRAPISRAWQGRPQLIRPAPLVRHGRLRQRRQGDTIPAAAPSGAMTRGGRRGAPNARTEYEIDLYGGC